MGRRRHDQRCELRAVGITSDDDLFRVAEVVIQRSTTGGDDDPTERPNGVYAKRLVDGLPQVAAALGCHPDEWPARKRAFYCEIEATLGGRWERSPFTRGTRFPRGTVRRALRRAGGPVPPMYTFDEEAGAGIPAHVLSSITDWLRTPEREVAAAEARFHMKQSDTVNEPTTIRITHWQYDTDPAPEPAPEPEATPREFMLGVLIYDPDPDTLATRRTILGELADRTRTTEQLCGLTNKEGHEMARTAVERELASLRESGLVDQWRERWFLTERGRRVVAVRGDCAWGDTPADPADLPQTPREQRLVAAGDAALELLEYIDYEVTVRYGIKGFHHQIDAVAALRGHALRDDA